MKLSICKQLKAFFLTLSFFSIPLFSSPLDNIKQYTLENGMEVFLLEDKNDAIVHIEYTCKAGFSSQTKDNAGFYKLYTRLVEKGNPSLSFSSVQCNADSSRYFLDIANPDIEETLSLLADAMFSPSYDDDLLSNELNRMKSEVKTASEDMSVYINSAIDSKVFSDTPWKHDSGIYPSIFKHTSQKEARNYIKTISDKWYTPQNSALFISGNINIEKLLPIINNTFGRFFSSSKTPVSKPLKAINKNRKFVLHSPELSTELTQVVVQYTTLSMESVDILASSLNNNNSLFKYNLLSIPELNILGDEYINVSGAHQKDNSRLIIQTLIQPPLDKNIKTNSVTQAEQFVATIKNIPSLITEMEFLYGKGKLINDMNNIAKDSVSLMNYLSSFWAIEPYYSYEEQDNIIYPNSSLANKMMNRVNKINETSLSTTLSSLQAENPFVFVIINSKDYKQNKKEYEKLGYEEITPDNASWYVQEMYKEIIKEQNEEKESQYLSYSQLDKASIDNQYYKRNINEIKQSSLKNGINVVTKKNTDTSDVTLLLSIKGGKLKSSDNNGFEEVMTNILASLIEKEIFTKQQQGLILYGVNITTDISLNTSSVLISFNKDDIIQICDAIKNGIIYGEIPPAVADKEVSSRRYKKRLENGSAVNQMYSKAISTLYGEKDLFNIYETENEILEDTEYLSILASYPELLDSSRYSIIITGNYPDNINELLEASLGLLSNNEILNNKEKEVLSMPNRESINVKITHTFLTDIPKEEAGPQPAVLIPTTEFLDPVMYIIKAPEYGTRDSALFKSVLLYLEKELQKELDNNPRLLNTTVSVRLPENRTNFGTIIFQNVKHTKEIDSIYKTVINNMKETLLSSNNRKLVQNIKNYWTTQKMKNTRTNEGTAILLQQGFEQFSETPIPYIYLLEYNYIQQASEKNFSDIMKYFPSIADFRLYSKDSKK